MCFAMGEVLLIESVDGVSCVWYASRREMNLTILRYANGTAPLLL